MGGLTAIGALVEQEGLPPHYLLDCERYWRPVAAHLAAARSGLGRGLVAGVSGPQGSGKSTLCLFLEALLREVHGLRVATLSLDDLYLPRAARLQLAREVHPLFATRGVPGTHETELGRALVDRLLRAEEPVPLPRFDKATDERCVAADWPIVRAPVDIVLFEGWCVGLSPQPLAMLELPVNALERDEDGDAGWRGAVNQALANYASLFAMLDRLIFLRPPDLDAVRRWRRLQEARLVARTGRGMAPAAVDRFVDHFERLTLHAAATLPGRSDLLIDLGDDHRPLALHRHQTSDC